MYKYKILNPAELSEALTELPDWKNEENKISATFSFTTFKDAITFINLIAEEAERINHHPDWSNNYKKVEISLCTHAAGNKVSDLDIKLAKFISHTAKDLI